LHEYCGRALVAYAIEVVRQRIAFDPFFDHCTGDRSKR
jgi:hypothetical protein